MRGALGDRLSDRSACTGRTPRCTEPKKTALQRVRMEEWRTWWFLWMALDGLSLLMEEQQSLCACCGRARRGARLCPEPRWGAVGGHAAAGAKKKGCRVKSAAALRDLARRTGPCSNSGRADSFALSSLTGAAVEPPVPEDRSSSPVRCKRDRLRNRPAQLRRRTRQSCTSGSEGGLGGRLPRST